MEINNTSNYEITFDKDYRDILKFLGARKGTILTTIPYHYCGKWYFLLYDIAYYELDLEHVYIKEEVETLVKNKKIVLLDSKPYISAPYQSEFKEYENKELKTIKNYDFLNLDNNGLQNNILVLSMIKDYLNNSKLNENIKTNILENYKAYVK